MEEIEAVAKLQDGEDYLVCLSSEEPVSEALYERIEDSIDSLSEKRDGNIFPLVVSDKLELEDADKVSQDVVQRIADRVIAKLIEQQKQSKSEKKTPPGGKTHT